MKTRISLIFPLLFCVTFSFAHFAAAQDDAEPDHKTSPYVVDEPSVLSLETRQTLESWLKEHHEVSGEEFVLGIFNQIPGNHSVTAEEMARKIFTDWRIGEAQEKNTGLLVALFWKEKKIAVETGFGLESYIEKSQIEDLTNRVLKSALKKEKRPELEKAMKRFTLALLNSVESPVVEKIQADLGEDSTADLLVDAQVEAGGFWSILKWTLGLFLGPLLFLGILAFVLRIDLHFTREGVFKIRRAYFQLRELEIWWRNRKKSAEEKTASLPRSLKGAIGGW